MEDITFMAWSCGVVHRYLRVGGHQQSRERCGRCLVFWGQDWKNALFETAPRGVLVLT